MDESTRPGGARAASGLRGRLRGAALALALLAAPLAAQAQTPDEDPWYQGPLRAIDIGVDVVLLRPLSIIALAGGTALFVPAAIMGSPGGSDAVGEAWELFVLAPAGRVWEKPLGEF